MKKILTWLILPPITVILVAFAIANRSTVAVTFDPIPFQVDLPLFIVLFLGILIGLIAGGILTWLGQSKWRRETRVRRRENRDLTRDIVNMQDPPASPKDVKAPPAQSQALLPR